MGSKEYKIFLAVDLDNVAGEYNTFLRRVVAERRGVSIDEVPEPVDWSMSNLGFTEKDPFINYHQSAVEGGMFKNMDPMEGVSESLWRLSNEGVHIAVVTHRLVAPGYGFARQVIQDTVEWLDKCKIPYRDICFIANKSMYRADLFIDDAVHNIQSIKAAGMECILFDQSHNQEYNEVPRVKSWNEAEEIIREYANTRNFPRA